MLTLLNFDFSIIGLTETRLKKYIDITTPITLENYSYEHTLTESSRGGVLLYISNQFNCKPRHDVLIYKPSLLESIFVEIIFPKKSNIVVGCMYKDPTMEINEFNTILSPLLHRVSMENKIFLLLGDFNIDLINCNTDNNTSEFLNLVSSYNITPHITLPTRITDRSQTLNRQHFLQLH